MPTQSTAHNTIGLPDPSITKPRAESGSSIFSAGLTSASQSGAPIGGVTSAENVAMRSVDSSAPRIDWAQALQTTINEANARSFHIGSVLRRRCYASYLSFSSAAALRSLIHAARLANGLTVGSFHSDS